MEQFILQHEFITLDNLEINTRLFPINTELINYIDTYKIYTNQTNADSDLSNFITEMTPILYNNMDSSIRANYYI